MGSALGLDVMPVAVIAIKIADFSQTIRSLRVFGLLRGLQDHIFIHRSETGNALNIFGAEFA